MTDWALSLRRTVDAITTLFMQAYMAARERAAGHASPTVRALAAREGDAYDLALLRLEVEVFRRRLESMPSLKRPHMPGECRFEVLQFIRLRGLSIENAARRYVLHPNTIRDWQNRFLGRGKVGLFFGPPPFNRIGDSVRWLVHQIRELCPEPEFGTRTIAMAIVRAGIRLSRRSVQRILREYQPKPPRDRAASVPTADETQVRPHHILRPTAPNRTWHLDLTTFEFLWVRFYVAALLDGFSRRLLALKVYRDAPTTAMLAALVQGAVRAFGAPRFLVTDHWCQFRKTFKKSVERLGISLIKGRKDSKTFNGKAERFFKTLKLWQRLTLFAWKIEWIQRRLDVFREWFDAERPMWVLGGRTPEEMWGGSPALEPVPIRFNDPQPAIRVTRRSYRGDRRLLVLDIQVGRSLKRSA